MNTLLIILIASFIAAFISLYGAKWHLKRYGFSFSDPIALLHVAIYSLAISSLMAKSLGVYSSLTVVIIFSFIMTISIVDTLSTLMPKQLTFGLILVVFLTSALNGNDNSFNAVCVGMLSTILVWEVIYNFLNMRKKGSLGKGDVYFMAGIGGWLGFTNSLYASLIGLILFTASLMTLRVSNVRLEGAPLGPFLSIGAIVTYCML